MSYIIIPSRAEIWRHIAPWVALNPQFLWVPDSPSSVLLDRVTNKVGTPVGGAVVNNAGIVNPAVGGDRSLSFATNLGLTGGSTFAVAMIVSVDNPSAVSGCIFKIGSGTDGLSFGSGAPYFESTPAGSLVVLVDNKRWGTAVASGWSAGVNIVCCSVTSNFAKIENFSTGVVADASALGYISPSAILALNGHGATGASRSSNIKVHAAAVWVQSFGDAAGDSFRAARAAEVIGLSRMDRARAERLFSSRQRRIYFGAGGGTTTTDAAIAGTQATDVAAITAEATTGAALAGTQATDVAAVTVEATTGAAIAGTQITDVAAVTVEATTGAEIAGTQASDVAAVQVTASTGTGVDADMAGVQASDVAAVAVSATLGLAISATQASDAGYIVVEATLPASMAGTQASDVAAITMASASIWTDVGVSAATWSDVSGATSIWTEL